MNSVIDKAFSSILNPILAFLEKLISFIFMNHTSTIIFGFIFLNALGFFLMRIDKKIAQYNGKVKEENPDLEEKSLKKLLRSRISERALILTAMVGGSLGIIGGMYKFRHKTQKPLFKYGVPIIIAIQVILIIWKIIDTIMASNS